MKGKSKQRNWTRPFGRVITVVVVFLLGGYLISNSLLGYFAEKELKKRTRLVWSVGSASWSPWGGVRLGDLRAELQAQPGQSIDPIIKVARVQVSPYWTTLFQKRPEFREVVIEKPDGSIPLELISLLAVEKGRSQVPEENVPVLPREQDPSLPEKKKERQKKKPTGVQDTKKEKDKKSRKKPELKSDKKNEAPPKVVEKSVEVALPSRVIVREGRFRIYAMTSKSNDVQFERVNLTLPVAGPEAKGLVEIQTIRIADTVELKPISFQVNWKEPFLDLPAKDWEWQGLKIRYGGRVQLKGGARYSLVFQGLPGEVRNYESPHWTGVQVGAEQVKTLLVRSEGVLRRPGTWRADVLADVRGVNLAQKDRQVGHRFDLAQFVAVYRQGVFRLADVRLRSERFSVMGNGLMMADGRLWSVVRVVADSEISQVISRIAVGSHISQGWMSSWMKPMGTPDRRYRDLHIQGKVPQIFVDVGRKREQLELGKIVQLMRMFFRGEVAEEVVLESKEREEGSSQ